MVWGKEASSRKQRPQDVASTPWDLFQSLDREFGFTLDVCALPDNAKCSRYYTPEEDGLIQPWSGVCWMNPPYSQLKEWMSKAVQEWAGGCTVVCLVPVRSDLGWWQDYALQGEIRFIRGRLKFAGHTSTAPFPSAIIVFQ